MSMMPPKLSLPKFQRVPAERGECFHNAFLFMLANPEWEVVHGTPLGMGPIEGLRFAHGWNEIEHEGIRWAYDAFADLLIPAAMYYTIGQIDYATTYTAAEMCRLALSSQHSGPWDERVSAAMSRSTEAN
jgi:hypothetical protein